MLFTTLIASPRPPHLSGLLGRCLAGTWLRSIESGHVFRVRRDAARDRRNTEVLGVRNLEGSNHGTPKQHGTPCFWPWLSAVRVLNLKDGECHAPAADWSGEPPMGLTFSHNSWCCGIGRSPSSICNFVSAPWLHVIPPVASAAPFSAAPFSAFLPPLSHMSPPLVEGRLWSPLGLSLSESFQAGPSRHMVWH